MTHIGGAITAGRCIENNKRHIAVERIIHISLASHFMVTCYHYDGIIIYALSLERRKECTERLVEVIQSFEILNGGGVVFIGIQIEHMIHGTALVWVVHGDSGNKCI